MAGARPLAGPLAAALAWRFLTGHRSRLLAGTARAALAATALGVTAMVIAMALMTGYSRDLQAKLIGDNAAVGAYPLRSAPALSPEVLARLAALPGVERVGRVVYGQGMLAGAGGDAVEITLRGEEAGKSRHTRAEDLAAGPDGIAGAVLGAELARVLGARPGDFVRVTALGFAGDRPRFRYQSLRVTNTFATGFSEFDRSWLVADRAVVERLVGGGAGTVLYEFALRDPALAPEVAEAAEPIVGPEYVVTDWRNLNRELFAALALQKKALFLALGLIVLVSTFNTASTLVVLVRERMRDIGALAAMGLAPRRIAATFVVTGMLLGLAGTLLGAGIGAGISWLLTTFRLIRFNPEVAAIYFIDFVPFRIAAADLGWIIGFSLLLTFLACLIPALGTLRIQPAAALRYE